jgi:Tol biopolymer transport system component
METVGNETALSGSSAYRLVRAELGRVLASAPFQGSARLSRFLEFVVERTLAGEANELKEYRIGLEVFGRPASYDPRLDPVVRVEARRLRKRLARYYESEGLQNGLRITIPKGAYAANFTAGTASDSTDSNLLPYSPDDSAKSLFDLTRTGRGRLVAGILLAVVVAAGSYAIHSLLLNRRSPFATISVRKITRSGKANFAAISPDGKYILNALDDDGMESLWLRNLPSGSDVQVLPPEPVHYRGLQFSRDGNYLYFVRGEEGNQGLAYLYRVPVLGGQPQRLLANVDTNISFSPDGKTFVFGVYNTPEGQYRLVIASLDGGAEKNLATGPVNAPVFDPAWSPDGKTIVCTTREMGSALSVLLAFDVATGNQRVLFKSGTARLSRPVWLPDGSGILVLSSDQSSNFTEQQIELVSYPQGKSHPVTRDTNSYSDISVAGDGSTLVTVLAEPHWNLFVTRPGASPGSTNETRQLTSDASVRSFGWTRDNKLVVSQDSGLSLLDPTSGSKFTLTVPTSGAADQPSVCPDGRTVLVLASPENGALNVWRMDANGTNLKRLTTGRSDRSPVCSGDGRSVYYEDPSQSPNLRVVALEGGESRAVGERTIGSCLGCVRPFDISSDGKLAVFSSFLNEGQKLVLLRLDGHSNSQLFDFRQPPDRPAIRFAPSGDGVAYPVRNRGVDNLWVQRLDGLGWSQWTDFPAERIRDFQFSPDGSQLAVTRGHVDSDVILVRDTDR